MWCVQGRSSVNRESMKGRSDNFLLLLNLAFASRQFPNTSRLYINDKRTVVVALCDLRESAVSKYRTTK